MEKIRLMIVDDHGLVRAGLRSFLSMFPHMEVVAEASSAEQCEQLIPQSDPDIILMDIRLTGKSGIDACREIKKVYPSIQLIMLTSFDSKELIEDALSAGASGYVLKEISAQELLQTIETVYQGAMMLDQKVKDKLTQSSEESSEESHLLDVLTEQEKHVLQHITYGRTNREIGELMDISEKTVRNYVSIILEKLDVHNRTEAAAFVYRHDLDQ